MSLRKTDQLVEMIAQQISDGFLQPGARLQSIRDAAKNYRVSKNTVVEAYGRLTARQLIVSRPGSGFYVSGTKILSELPEREAPLAEAYDMVTLLRAQLDKEFTVRVGDGRPPASWTTDCLPKRLTSEFLAKADRDPSGYGNLYGHRDLRDLIAGQYRHRGIRVAPRQILTTFGANHAFDMLIRRYLAPGDMVLVDEPGYYPLFAKLKLAGVGMAGVQRIETGPDLDDLRRKAERHGPKMFFTQSTAHNPTGSNIDLATAHGILRIADRYGFMVVDDDPFIELSDPNAARLPLLDQYDKVIGIGTYSKILSASFRTGYLIANQTIVDELAEFKLITTVNSSRLSEILISEMTRTGRIQKHLKRLVSRLEAAKSACLSKFNAMDLMTHTPNPEGFFTMLILPAGVSERALAASATRRGIFLAQKAVFCLDPNQYPPAIRVNFTRADDIRFFNFLKEFITQ
jgi:DNA-binding transcriptional MocR family regulator